MARPWECDFRLLGERVSERVRDLARILELLGNKWLRVTWGPRSSKKSFSGLKVHFLRPWHLWPYMPINAAFFWHSPHICQSHKKWEFRQKTPKTCPRSTMWLQVAGVRDSWNFGVDSEHFLSFGSGKIYFVGSLKVFGDMWHGGTWRLMISKFGQLEN